MSLIPAEIEAHYRQANEAERLTGPLDELEFLRTQAILARVLPPPPAVVLDVGGAAGAYAIPLAKQGYHVHLVDPVDLHLEQARSRATKSGVELKSISRGDSRQLNFSSGGADCVLLLGPLYHLIGRADRLQALREARRVLRPRGLLAAAAISRFASFVAGLAVGSFSDPTFRKIVAEDLRSGEHRNPTDEISYFTTAYFHRPDELTIEVRDAGFQDTEVLAVEGPVWSASQFQRAWADEVQRQAILEFLSSIEREPSLLCASAHFLAISHAPL
jgi:ubiquinone/menaquinone biosynthesis C-methylase UbiE